MTTTNNTSSWRSNLAISAVALGLAVIGAENGNAYADEVSVGKEAYSISDLTQKAAAKMTVSDEGCSHGGGMGASGSACVTEAAPPAHHPIHDAFTKVSEKLKGHKSIDANASVDVKSPKSSTSMK